jgi:hypothetical protein
MRTRRRLSWIAGATLFATLASVELVLRVGFDRDLRNRSFPCIYEPDPEIGYRYKPSTTGRLCIPDICRTVTINANGFPGEPFSDKKRAGDYRIAVVSDSDATGIWTEDGESYVTLLRRRLATVSPRLEVLNVSIDGMDRDIENLAHAREAVRRYSPDLVLLHTHIPFVSRHQQREVYRGYVLAYPIGSPAARSEARASIDDIESHTVGKALYQASYVVRLASAEYLTHSTTDLARLLQTHMTGKYSAETPAMPEAAKTSLAELVETQRSFAAAGTRLVLLGDMDDRKLAKAASEGELDLVPYAQPSGAEFHLPNNSHLTHKGHQVIADQLYEALMTRLRAWGVFTRQQAAVEANEL